jgi:hypothetical protein
MPKYRQPPQGSARELADVERMLAQIRDGSLSGESWLPDNMVQWARLELRATYAYATRLESLARDEMVKRNTLSAEQTAHRLVLDAESVRRRAMDDKQYAAAVSALKAQGDWLLPKQNVTGDQHVHLHFAAELDAVEQRMRAARAIAAGFPALLPETPPEQALLDQPKASVD